jgi:hypothetical protein
MEGEGGGGKSNSYVDEILQGHPLVLRVVPQNTAARQRLAQKGSDMRRIGIFAALANRWQFLGSPARGKQEAGTRSHPPRLRAACSYAPPQTKLSNY